MTDREAVRACEVTVMGTTMKTGTVDDREAVRATRHEDEQLDHELKEPNGHFRSARMKWG